jgi:hypothetical protein
MRIKRSMDNAEIELTYDELLVFNAALNEVCNGIDVLEFETRIGASRAEVERLMVGVQTALDLLRKK